MAQNITTLSERAKRLGLKRDPAARNANADFGEGIFESYPVLSILGKEWTLRLPGQKKEEYKKQLNQDGEPSRAIPLILLKASAGISKSWWSKGFDEYNPTPPECYSTTGKVPEPNVPNRQSPVCAPCVMNQIGSASLGGKTGGGKACGDKKVIVVIAPTLMDMPFRPALLRVPATSLKAIKEYTDGLSADEIYVHRVITMARFSKAVTHAQLEFEDVKGIPDAYWEAHIKPLLEGDLLDQMLRTAINAGNVEQMEAGAVPMTPRPASAPARISEPAPAPKVKPADPEGYEGLDVDFSGAPAKAAAEPEDEVPFDMGSTEPAAPETPPASAVEKVRAKKAASKTPVPAKNGDDAVEVETKVTVIDTPDEVIDVISSLFPDGLPGS